MAKILVIEDDDDFSGAIKQALKSENHSIEIVDHGQEGLSRLCVYDYDLAIVDWGLPDIQGTEVCKKYKDSGGKALILMLTGKAAEKDKEAGLDAGADDYLTKPFNIRELLARVRSLLRRAGSTSTATETFRIADVELSCASCRVTKGGTELTLSRKEYSLLEAFMRDPKRVYSVEVLLSKIWSDSPDASESTVRTHIKTLRKKIDTEGAPTLIDTVHGVGYRLRS